MQWSNQVVKLREKWDKERNHKYYDLLFWYCGRAAMCLALIAYADIVRWLEKMQTHWMLRFLLMTCSMMFTGASDYCLTVHHYLPHLLLVFPFFLLLVSRYGNHLQRTISQSAL